MQIPPPYLLPNGIVLSDAYKIAVNGGRNAGFLQNNIDRSTRELQTGINSLQKQITLHENKILYPDKYIPEWHNLDPRQQRALKNRKWPSDIQRLTEHKNILKSILDLRHQSHE